MLQLSMDFSPLGKLPGDDEERAEMLENKSPAGGVVAGRPAGENGTGGDEKPWPWPWPWPYQR